MGYNRWCPSQRLGHHPRDRSGGIAVPEPLIHNLNPSTFLLPIFLMARIERVFRSKTGRAAFLVYRGGAQARPVFSR